MLYFSTESKLTWHRPKTGLFPRRNPLIFLVLMPNTLFFFFSRPLLFVSFGNNYVIGFSPAGFFTWWFTSWLFLVPRRTDWQSLPLQQQNLFLELVQALATIGIVALGIWMSSQFSLWNRRHLLMYIKSTYILCNFVSISRNLGLYMS